MLVQRDLEEYVPVPEGRIHFVKTGSGTPVVFLHPMGTSTWAWHTVLEPLGQHFTCYAFDMLGHGKSDKPNRHFAMPDWARSMDHAMQVMNIHRAHIVGNSVGAVLGVEIAASYPDRVEKLVLVGAPVWDPRGAQQRIEDGAASYDENDMPVPRTAAELKSATTFTNPRPEWVEETNELRTRAGTWVRKTSESLAWYDVVSRLPLIKATATLVLTLLWSSMESTTASGSSRTFCITTYPTPRRSCFRAWVTSPRWRTPRRLCRRWLTFLSSMAPCQAGLLRPYAEAHGVPTEHGAPEPPSVRWRQLASKRAPLIATALCPRQGGEIDRGDG